MIAISSQPPTKFRAKDEVNMLFGQQYNSQDEMPARAASSTSTNTFKVRTKTKRFKKKQRAGVVHRIETKVPSESMYSSVWHVLGFREKAVELTPESCDGPICVTGVDGFVSAWIVALLLEKGFQVRGIVQSRNDDVSGIVSLPKAETHLKIIEASLLTPESCDLAIQGCSYVIHTGTPSSCAVRDPLSEAQEPGVHSIGSRMHCIIPMMTNFIQACARARIKKLILTSSIAAMADSCSPAAVITDTAWNLESTLEKNPHFLSLKMAEEAAWQLVDQLPRESKFELVCINGGTMIGPVLCASKTVPAGNQVIYDLISGKYSALVDLNWAMIDVRDCAKAHIAALQNFSARGRFICVNRTIWLQDIVEILSENGYRARDLPWRVGLPNWVARLPSYAIQLGQVGASLYASDDKTSCVYLNDKIRNILRLDFRDPKATVLDCAGDLLKWGFIKPWDEDHEAIDCAECSYAFTFYRRKHHCRECGVIVCSECSQSRAVVEGLQERARLCDACVRNSIPAFLELLKDLDFDNQRKAVIALESLMENPNNHDYVMRSGGLPLLMNALHADDSTVAKHAAGALYALSSNLSSSLQMVLEGVVLQMLEVQENSSAWRVALQALRNIWRQVNKPEFRQMLFAVSRVSSDSANDELQGNILLTFVHMMEPVELKALLPEGLVGVLYRMLKSPDLYPRCAAAHGIKHLLPMSYRPDMKMDVPPYTVDDHEELLTNSSLSDLQFLVKGHIAPINAHKVVLFFRSSYFKNMFGSSSTSNSTVVIDNCPHHVFSMILRFLYTGRVQIESSSAQELLRAASCYQVYELQKRVEKFLVAEITVHNVVTLLRLADETRAEDLKRICIAYLMQNIHETVRLVAYEEHREWASREVLDCLAQVLGRDWEGSLRQVLLEEAAQPENTPSASFIAPDSPLGKALRQKPASPKRFNIIADLTSEPVGEESVEPPVNSPVKRLSQVWSDDFSDRSEGVC